MIDAALTQVCSWAAGRRARERARIDLTHGDLGDLGDLEHAMEVLLTMRRLASRT